MKHVNAAGASQPFGHGCEAFPRLPGGFAEEPDPGLQVFLQNLQPGLDWRLNRRRLKCGRQCRRIHIDQPVACHSRALVSRLESQVEFMNSDGEIDGMTDEGSKAEAEK